MILFLNYLRWLVQKRVLSPFATNMVLNSSFVVFNLGLHLRWHVNVYQVLEEQLVAVSLRTVTTPNHLALLEQRDAWF